MQTDTTCIGDLHAVTLGFVSRRLPAGQLLFVDDINILADAPECMTNVIRVFFTTEFGLISFIVLSVHSIWVQRHSDACALSDVIVRNENEKWN